jgi:hypothetical protein
MNFPCTIHRRPDGQWSLRHESRDVGSVEVTAPTREQAAEKMRGEIRYRLELCPCTGETYRHITIEISELAGSPPPSSRPESR